MDKLVDKPVDNAVHNRVDNPEEDQYTWFNTLADYLPGLYSELNEHHNNQLKQLIRLLGQALEAGHTCLGIDQQLKSQIPHNHPAIVDESQARNQPAPLVRAGDYLYFFRQWQQEHGLAMQLARILQGSRLTGPGASSDTPGSSLGQTTPVDWPAPPLEHVNAQQQQAINLAITRPFSLITGGPGTGKTYTLVKIVHLLQQQQPDLRIALAAPTGKAAQRMQSVLDRAFWDAGIESSRIQSAQTVHRLLGLGMTGTAQFDGQTPLPYDLIVVDEGSMLDLALASVLFAAIAPTTRLIILGDADQLAAVDAGAVLADLQQTPALVDYQVHLVQSQRFSATAGIGQLANGILQQNAAQVWQALHHTPEQLRYFNPQHCSDRALFDQLWQGFMPYVTALQRQASVAELFACFDQYRILAAMRAGRLGTLRINQEMSRRLQHALHQVAGRNPWFHGRPVMMQRNDYNLKLSNGDIGLCLKDANQQWQIHFPTVNHPIAVTRLPLQDISTAFALTIHKSQGSEFDQVAVTLEDTAANLLSRELLYTAVTRAKKRVQLWGSPASINEAINNKALRRTGLQRQLQQQLAILPGQKPLPYA